MIQSSYLNSIANQVKTDVSSTLVNDSIVISSFDLEQVTNNVYEVTFRISQAQTTQITNLKLRKADNTVISSNDVNIPITETEVIIRLLLTISEVTA